MKKKQKKIKNFLNRSVIQHFINNNHQVVAFNGASMYKIDGKVDVYRNSSKIRNCAEGIWIETTAGTILKTIYSILK